MAELKGLYSIAPGEAFADRLAAGLLSHLGADADALAATTVLLPTRRACIGLRDAFLRVANGEALILPRLLPLGDLDETEAELALAPAPWAGAAEEPGPLAVMAPLRRQLLLTRLILHWAERRGATDRLPQINSDQAVRLAAALAQLQDEMDTEGLSFESLAALVPDRYAAHWQETLKFLAIVSENWPQVEAELGVTSAAKHRRAVALAQAEAWMRQPPSDPVVVAGSTGSVPATATLIASVAAMPKGIVVFPGLDHEAPEAVWDEIGRDPSHPQYGMARLLSRLDAGREAVKTWPAAGELPCDPLRRRFAAAALYPAESTLAWRDLAATLPPEELAGALRGVRRVDCSDPGEEARVIALMMRRQAEDPEATAALVTPDRELARRVAAELRRWQIEVDDSAGTPLGKTPPGAFLQLLAQAAASAWAPLECLALLKHPLAAAGEEPGSFRRKVRRLEIAVLRGPRPPAGLEALAAALAASEEAGNLGPWFAALAARLAPLEAVLAEDRRPLADIVTAHIAAAEALAASDSESGATRLWREEAGEAAAAFVSDLLGCAEAGLSVACDNYPAVLQGLLQGLEVRPRYGLHPRLHIWGTLEARMQTADLLILGGLNEGTWPAAPESGPWLSRPMRESLGLPLPERAVGLAAHDFLQGFAAPQVVLTRSNRVAGTPSVPSRWLLRLDALAKATDLPKGFAESDGPWPGWAAALDAPQRWRPRPAPAPRPPLAARPRQLSVTRIETWVRDPYALYAERILGLRALDPIDADPSLADLGTLVHRILEIYMRRHPQGPPCDPRSELLAVGGQVFSEQRNRPGVRAFWWPRFLRIADWLAGKEAERATSAVQSFAEVRGRLTFAAPGGDFTLTATADRIDLSPAGRLAIIDYKTGSPPTQKAVVQGIAPQLPLEAAIAKLGGFDGIAAVDPESLAFWKLSGGAEAGRVAPIKGAVDRLADDALAGLKNLVAAFDNPETPYPAVPRRKWELRYNDYAHLARLKEWAQSEDGEDGGAS